jgi:SAM-dependent methyltransferase
VNQTNECISNLYLTDEYVSNNPSLHREDSSWKISKIIPFVDAVIGRINKKEINVLDVGGGAGLILNAVSSHIEKKYGKKVNKFALDLSPAMLEIQRKENPDLKKALNESISNTSLNDREIDLVLMIDVLEHIPNPTDALAELRRISRFAIFKVPLENNLCLITKNLITKNRAKAKAAASIGHINFYTFGKLKGQTEKYLGKVIDSSFTNVFDYFLQTKKEKGVMKLCYYAIASLIFKLSPRLCSLLFNDFVMILAERYDTKLGQRKNNRSKCPNSGQ